MRALLGLIRPSAYIIGTHNQLQGEGGAFVSAELVSLTPQTVVYTLDTQLRWSNGQHFSARDVTAWWRRARSIPLSQFQGYRDIARMTTSVDGRTVTVVFGSPDTNWNTLFRDIEPTSSAARTCSLSDLVKRPSLGPYRLVSLSSTRAVLKSNPAWTNNFNRFGRVTLQALSTWPSQTKYLVRYSDQTNSSLVADRPKVLLESRLIPSSFIEEIQFAPNRPLTRTIALRRTWSWLINRQNLVQGLFSQYTLTAQVADSAFFAQNQSGFVGAPGSEEVASLAKASAMVDCLSCARRWLRDAGYSLNGQRLSKNGNTVTLTLVTGPTMSDQMTADAVIAQLRDRGIQVTRRSAASDALAAHLAFANQVDLAIFERPVSVLAVTPSVSLSPPFYADSFAIGRISTDVQTAVASANADFNPLTALATMHSADEAVLNTYLIRPLFTPPAFLQWTPAVANTGAPSGLDAVVDQIVNWGVNPAR